MTADKVWHGLLNRLQAAEKDISAARGSFTLFVLVERDEAPGKWDLLVSAPWLASGRHGIQDMVDRLQQYLMPPDWLQLASITPLLPAMEYVRWIGQRYDVQHDRQEVVNVFWDGVFIPHGYVITANPAPAIAIQHPIAA